MSEWKAGFARPWIEWNGVEGEAGRVYVDGERVPLTEVWCDLFVGEHDAWHDHCHNGNEDPIGFSWAMPLENRLWVICLVDEHVSVAHIDTDPGRERCPVDLSLNADPPTAWLCENNWADECGAPGHRSWDLGDTDGWVEFDSYAALMNRVRFWSGLKVEADRPRIAGRRPMSADASHSRKWSAAKRAAPGTVTRDEYDAGVRPAWWAES